jgi:hypothetical protein
MNPNLKHNNFKRIFLIFLSAHFIYKVPPVTLVKEKSVIYEDKQKLIKLTCDLKCANPSTNLEYVWELLIEDEAGNNNLQLAITDNKNTFEFRPIDFDKEQQQKSFSILCTIKNQVNKNSKTDQSNSQTRFNIINKGKLLFYL